MTAEPAACSKTGPDWERQAPAPYYSWPGNRYFLSVDGARHIGGTSAANVAMLYAAANFLNARIPG